MKSRKPAPPLARSKSPRARLKSERIQAFLAQTPGWSFDEDKSAFTARFLARLDPSAFEVGGGLVVALAQETRVEIRLSTAARNWTAARLESTRLLSRLLERQSGRRPQQAGPGRKAP